MNALANTPTNEAAQTRPAREMNVDEGQGAEVFYGARLDPQRMLAVLRAHWWLFALVASLIFLAAAAFTATAPRKYTATANVVLEAPQKPDPTGALQPAQPADSATVDTEVQLVQSRDIADQVVTALKLDQDPTFWAGSHRKAPTDPDQRHDVAVGIVQGDLKAKRSGLTSVIAITFTSRSPVLASRIANGYADQYLIAQSRAKLTSTKQSGAAIDDRLESLRKAALQDAAALAQYRNAHGLYGAEGVQLNEQEASAYNQQLAQAQSDYSADVARLNVAKSQLAHDNGSDARGVAVDSVVLQRLRDQRSQLTAQIADLSNRYGSRYPTVVSADKQLSDVNAGIQAEVNRIILDLQTRVEVSRQRLLSVQQALGSAKSRLAGGSTASVALDELNRKATASQQVYEQYLARSQQANASVGTEQPDARITNRAETPSKPSSPNVPLNLALGFIVAVGAGLGAVFAREALHSGLATGEDIEQRLGLPHLGSVPDLASVADRADRNMSPPDYLLAKPLSAFGEAVRGLRTSLKFAGGSGEGARIVVFTSSLPSEGKSTTSLCIARSAGQAGSRVLLVDCDLRRRSINKLLGVEPEVGLLEVLSGKAELKDVMFRDEASGAYILPLANSSSSPEEVFETAAMNKLLRDVAAEFDLVFLDTAPVLAVAETRVLAAKSDAVVFLAHWRKTPEKAIIAALKLLDAAGAPVAGVALTQVNMLQQARYGYGDATYYYANYKKYYST